MTGLNLVFSMILTLGGLFGPGAAEAQQAGAAARIGYLSPGRVATPSEAAFLQGMRDLGYVEGRNFVMEYRHAEEKPERFAALAAELVALKVDVIVAPGTLAALAAKRVTTTIPIVVPAVGNPVGAGLVASLARPGGNVTGLSIIGLELVGKALELLTQSVPGVSRVAVLWQPGATPEHRERDILKTAEVAARTLGLQPQFIGTRAPADFDRAFSDMIKARADGLAALPYGLFIREKSRLVELAAKDRLPAVYATRELADAGGLISYGPDVPDLFRRAATYVDKILKGAKPSDLPVEQPTKFEFVINLKTARTLGLTIPQSALARADHIIER